MPRKAVFLDRDGTIIPETGARTADPDVEPLPDAIRGIRKLHSAGFLVVIITNQAAVARGCFTEADLAVSHKALLRKFEKAGAPIDGLFYCPHLPEGSVPQYAIVCECRKPKPGLFLRAAKELDIDLAASYMVGDGERDITAAHAAGCKGAALIKPTMPQDFQIVQSMTTHWDRITKELEAIETDADAVVPDVNAAADWVLEMEQGVPADAEETPHDD